MKISDVVIIGAGVVGSAIARELSRYRLDICLLEKEEELSFGVSKSNSGIIHAGTQNPPGTLKARLCVEGNRLTRLVARELGVDFKETGQLIVAFDDQEKQRLERIRQEGAAAGVPGLRMVDGGWLKRHEPNLSESVRGALYAPSAGVLSPYRLVYDLTENAVKNGVRLYTQEKVEHIARCDGCFEVVTASGSAYRARTVINAAGLFADQIARLVGVSDFVIRPRKGEEFLLDKKRQYLTNHLIFPLPTPHSKGILVIKTADGNPMIGPTAVDTDDKEDLATSDEGLETVLQSVKRLIPAIDGQDIIAYFSGLRPVAGDDFIIRHEQSVPGFFTVAGIQSPGLTAAPAIAVLVAGLLRSHGLALKRKLFFHKYRRRSVHLFATGLKGARRLIGKDRGFGDIVCRCEMVSAQEIREAIRRGARTLDGIKFRTRAQAGRCHGGFCTTRVMKLLAEERKIPLTAVTKRGKGSEIVKGDRHGD